MLSPSARQKIANEAINFILQAFYAGVVYSVLAAGGTIYAWITGADQQWVFLGLGALGTLFLVLVTTGVVVWQRSKSKPLQTVGRKGYLDFRKDAEAAIHQLQVEHPQDYGNKSADGRDRVECFKTSRYILAPRDPRRSRKGIKKDQSAGEHYEDSLGSRKAQR